MESTGRGVRRLLPSHSLSLGKSRPTASPWVRLRGWTGASWDSSPNQCSAESTCPMNVVQKMTVKALMPSLGHSKVMLIATAAGETPAPSNPAQPRSARCRAHRLRPGPVRWKRPRWARGGSRDTHDTHLGEPGASWPFPLVPHGPLQWTLLFPSNR